MRLIAIDYNSYSVPHFYCTICLQLLSISNKIEISFIQMIHPKLNIQFTLHNVTVNIAHHIGTDLSSWHSSCSFWWYNHKLGMFSIYGWILEHSGEELTTDISVEYDQDENWTTLSQISSIDKYPSVTWNPSPTAEEPQSSGSSVEISTTDGHSVPPTHASPVEPLEPIICNIDGQYDGEYGIDHWPPVFEGQASSVHCPTGTGNASWYCVDDGLFEPTGPNWDQCNEWLDKLIGLPDICSERRISRCLNRAIEIIEFISNVTKKNNSIVESDKLWRVLDVVNRIQTFVESVGESELIQFEVYATNVVEALANIIDQKYAWVNTTNAEKTSLALKILFGVQSSVYSLSIRQNSNNSVVIIDNNDFYINTFFANKSEELTFPANNTNTSWIHIPAETSFVNRRMDRQNTAFGVIVRHIDSYLLGNLTPYQIINSDILTFSLNNVSQRQRLNKEVTIRWTQDLFAIDDLLCALTDTLDHRLQHNQRLEKGDRIDCVFWDFSRYEWSSDGCYKVDNESDLLQTICKCNHLTNFAALMDVTGREERTLVKAVLSYICSFISIVGLILTINMVVGRQSQACDKICSVKASLENMRSIITCNLCICLLITNLLVVFGMGRTNILVCLILLSTIDNPAFQWLCQLSSALLLYSLLSSFFWMLMEGYYLYRSLVLCFESDFRVRLLYLFGYGFPLAIIIIAFIIIYIKENIFLEALFDERYNHLWVDLTLNAGLIVPIECIDQLLDRFFALQKPHLDPYR